MFAGVDVIISINNENYIIECNRNPQFMETQRVLPDIDIANQVIKCLENPLEGVI
jgi:glutathione synthase/RimK-type ligase-like ATP-grasp enzyme